jgi:hypothetical protein
VVVVDRDDDKRGSNIKKFQKQKAKMQSAIIIHSHDVRIIYLLGLVFTLKCVFASFFLSSISNLMVVMEIRGPFL